MKKLLILFSLFTASLLFAQDEGRDLIKRMNKAYSTASSLSMLFQVDYYALAGQTSPSMKTNGEVKYSGRNYYSNAMGKHLLVNKKYSLIIDEVQHTITCMPGSEENKKNQATNNKTKATGLPDSSWLTAAKIKLLAQLGNSRQVEIITNDPVYEKTVLKINTLTYALEEVAYYYKKLENGSSPMLIVSYSSIKFGIALTEADFSEKKYILKKAFEDVLPAEILYRPKKGFGVPLVEYFRDELRDYAHDEIFNFDAFDYYDKDLLRSLWQRHQAKSSDYSRLFWSIMMFNLWYKKWMI